MLFVIIYYLFYTNIDSLEESTVSLSRVTKGMISKDVTFSTPQLISAFCKGVSAFLFFYLLLMYYYLEYVRYMLG